MAEELLVRVANPAALDQTMRQLGGVVEETSPGQYAQVEPGVYVVRLGDYTLECVLDFLAWSIEHQGYGTVVGRREIS